MSTRRLFESVLQRDHDALRAILSQRVNPDALLEAQDCSEDEDDQRLVEALNRSFTPLFVAAAIDDAEACRILIEAGADPDAAGTEGHSVLMEAAEKASLACMRVLLSKMHFPSAVNKDGETALFYAAASGSEKAVQILLDHGLDLEHCDVHGRTVLFLSIHRQGNPCFEFLLSKNANARHRAHSGVTTIMAACVDYRESDGLVQRLIACGVDVNAQTRTGCTALGIAARAGSMAVVRALVSAGALVSPPNAVQPLCMAASEFNSTNPDGRHLRCHLWSFSLTRSYGIPEILQYLIDLGADPDCICEEGLTPLMYAAQKDAAVSIDVLLRNGASLCAVDNRGWTALHYAAVDDRLKAVRTLLERGIPVDQPDFDGDTALMCAAYHGKLKAVGLLLRLGADPARKDALGLTAMDAAKSNGHENLAAGLYRRVERRSR